MALILVMLSVLWPSPASALQPVNDVTIQIAAPATAQQPFTVTFSEGQGQTVLRDGDTATVPTYPSEISFATVPAVSVATPLGWMAESVTCTGLDTTDYLVNLNLDGQTSWALSDAYYFSDPTGPVVCTFNLVPAAPATITVTKVAANSNGQVFDIFNGLRDGESFSQPVVPGTNRISAGLLGGWTWSAVTCNSTLPPEVNLTFQRFEIGTVPGEQVACTVTSSRIAQTTVTVTSVIENDDGRLFGYGIDTAQAGPAYYAVQGSTPRTVTTDVRTGRLWVSRSIDNGQVGQAADDLENVSASCVDADGGVLETQTSFATTVYMPDVQPGSNIACTFVSRIDGPAAVEIVTLAGRSDGWVKLGSSRNWVSAACRSQLVAAGAVVQEVSWPTLAMLADAVPFQRCEGLLSDLFDDGLPRIVTLAGRADGWVQVGLTRNWVSADCRARLEAVGAVLREISWPTLSTLVDATPFQRCDALLLELFGLGDIRIVTLAGRTDGWVQIGLTRNWVSPACRAELEPALGVQEVPWATLSRLVDAVPFQRCEALIMVLFE